MMKTAPREKSLQRIRASGTRIAGFLAWVLGAALVTGCATTGNTDPGAEAAAQPANLIRVEPVASTPPPPPRVLAAPAAAPTPSPARQPPDWTAQSSLWNRIRAGFALDPLETPLVAEKERFYLSRPEHLERMLQRGGRYLFHIVEELERRGMPTEIALLPFVESAMNPVAVSPAQAAGLWQFVPATGKQYNLHQNWWVDNRRDPVKSTRAALD
ncbi:MAG: Membrane-bound lytic murein transglycosylase precursor, partial [Pseudomonadota bacterium]